MDENEKTRQKPKRMNLSQMYTGLRSRKNCSYHIISMLGRYDLGFCNKWPINRCIICGKMMRPNTTDYCTEFIDQILYTEYGDEKEFVGIVKVCLDHGGNDGREYVDALTGQRITAGKSPYFMDKLVKDWLREGKWIFSFIMDMIWYRVKAIALVARHPLRYMRWIENARRK